MVRPGGVIFLGSGHVGATTGDTPAPADQAAVALGVRLFGAGCVAWVAPAAAAGRCYAVAAGVKRTMTFDPSVISTIARGDDWQLAIFGSPIEPWGEWLPALLAERAAAGLAFDITTIERLDNGYRLVRDLGRGSREWLHVAGRAVVVLTPDPPRSLYLSRHRRRLAAEALASTPMTDEGSTIQWRPLKPRVHADQLLKKTTGAADDRLFSAFGIAPVEAADQTEHILTADAATCAAHLLRYLAHHGFIERHPSPLPDPEVPAISSVAVAPVAPQPTTSTERIPRPLHQPLRGAHRRPRPAGVAPLQPAGWPRRPRPVTPGRSWHARGPFPIRYPSSHSEIDHA